MGWIFGRLLGVRVYEKSCWGSFVFLIARLLGLCWDDGELLFRQELLGAPLQMCK